MLQIFREISETVFFCNLPYHKRNDASSSGLLQLVMATGTSSFDETIQYALEGLASGHLTLKEERLQAIGSVHNRKGVFVWLPTGFRKSLCYQAIPFVMDHKLGLSNTSESNSQSTLVCY